MLVCATAYLPEIFWEVSMTSNRGLSSTSTLEIHPILIPPDEVPSKVYATTYSDSYADFVGQSALFYSFFFLLFHILSSSPFTDTRGIVLFSAMHDTLPPQTPAGSHVSYVLHRLRLHDLLQPEQQG